MNEDINFTAGQQGLGFLSAVEAMLKRSCIIDFGIIQRIPEDDSGNKLKGLVDVSLAVSKTKQDMIIMTCVLANIASSSFTLYVQPHVGDRVLVVYPRAYDDRMFTVPNNDSEKTEILVNPRAKGYNLASGIAILFNQYKKNAHKNLIKIEDNSVSIIQENKCELELDSDGYISYQHLKHGNEGENKTKFVFTSSGMTLQDANGCTIESSANGVLGNKGIVINGNLKIKG
jgi:hypothetical protein